MNSGTVVETEPSLSVAGPMHDGQVEVGAESLLAVIEARVPALGRLPLRRLPSAGTVVAPFRLGDDYVVGVPLVPRSHDAMRRSLLAQGAHADFLRGRLPVEVPTLVWLGQPFDGYPGVWSV